MTENMIFSMKHSFPYGVQNMIPLSPHKTGLTLQNTQPRKDK